MPLTTTATWPTLTEGKKAKASEVEAKFDWLEGAQLPMNAGNFTTGAYDIGSATYQWRSGYFNNVVIGGITSGASLVQGMRAWLSIHGTAGTYTVSASYNISSVSSPGAGEYTINFTTGFLTSTAIAIGANGSGYVLVVDKSTTSIKVEHRNHSTDALETPTNMGVIVTGNQ